MASGGSATLVGSKVAAGGQAVLAYGVGPAAKVGASLNLEAAINSTLTQSSSTNNGLVVSTKVANTFTQSLTYNQFSPNIAFVGSGPINVDYQGALVNETQNSKAPQMPKGFGSWVGNTSGGCPAGVTCTTTNFTPAQIAAGLGASNDNLAYLGALNNNPSALVNTAAAITAAQQALQQLGVALDPTTLTPGGSGVNWNALTLTNQSATWETKSLNPIAQMIMDIALMTVMGPAGGNMLLAAGEAALVSLANSGVNGLISGQFDGGQAFENAAIAALTAALSSGVGDLKGALKIFPGNFLDGNFNPVATLESAVLHGAVGCVGSSLSGQSCGSGFVSGAVSDLANVVSTGNTASDLLFHSLIGGVASKLAGGDFATGALNAALEELFNSKSHEPNPDMNVQPGQPISGLDYKHNYQAPVDVQTGSPEAAANDLTQTAIGIDQYGHYCAEWVINALNIAGYKVPMTNAATAGQSLQDAGFQPVASEDITSSNRNVLPPDYTPSKGDVVVMVGGGKQHIAMFNGTNWVSDTVQSNISPYSKTSVRATFYKHP